MARLAIYLRRSSPGEEDKNYSLEDQLRDCVTWNEKLRHEQVKTYSDPGGKSWTLNRPGLNLLMEEAKSGLFDLVVVGRWDRFSRIQDQQTVAIYQLQKYGVTVTSATQPMPDGPLGTFVRNSYSFAAELELYNIRDRTMGGKKARARAGKLLPAAYPLYGYIWADPHAPRGKTRFLPDPESAWVVRMIYDLVLSGMTIRAIARKLQQDGIPTPAQLQQSRGLWPKGKPFSSIWRMSTLNRILSNPAYIGKHTGWRFERQIAEVTHPITGEIIERTRTVLRSEHDTDRVAYSQETCPALVEEATFYAVQQILQQNQQLASRNMNDPTKALLRGGFLHCGYCGRMMSSVLSPGKVYRYLCNATRNHIPCEGKAFSWKTEELDTIVWSWLMHAFEDPEVVRKKFHQWQLDKQQNSRVEHDRLQVMADAIRKAESRKRNYMSLAGDAVDPEMRAEYDQLAAAANQEIKGLTADYERLSGALTRQDQYNQRVENLVALGASVRTKLDGASYDDKRAVLLAFGVQVKCWHHDHYPPYDITWEFDHLHELWVKQRVLDGSVPDEFV
jgi:site-specific DNA recombinase